MKIVITSQGQDVHAAADPRFGRAKYFVVIDTDTNETSSVDNAQNLNAPQGAGIQAGQNVARLGVDAVVTGHVGPKAFTTLQAAGIDIYTGAAGTVAETLERFKRGELKKSDAADVEGHWV